MNDDTHNRVESSSMSSNLVPASAFIDVAISTNQEAVSNVTPTIAIDVPVLDAPDYLTAGGQVTAAAGLRVVDEQVGSVVLHRVVTVGVHCSPLRPGH